MSYCINCGNKLATDESYCASCGTKVTGGKSEKTRGDSKYFSAKSYVLPSQEDKQMINLNWKQKAVIGAANLLIIVSFLIPPCYIDAGDKNVPMGYIPFALFKVETTSSGVRNIFFLHAPTFYAQLTVIALITIGLILIFVDSKDKY